MLMLIYMILSFTGFKWIERISCYASSEYGPVAGCHEQDITLKLTKKKIQEFLDQLNDCHFFIKQNTLFYRIVHFS